MGKEKMKKQKKKKKKKKTVDWVFFNGADLAWSSQLDGPRWHQKLASGPSRKREK